MGATYDKGIEAARQLEAAGPFSPSAVPPAIWELLKTAFAGLFPHDEIGCEHGGCPGKVSRAYLRVTNELRAYKLNNPDALAQRSATSTPVTNQPTTNPNAVNAAQTNMANATQKDARSFHFKEGQSYMEFGAQVSYTNANLTDKIARRILKNDPAARTRFLEFPDSLLEGDTAAEGEHAAGAVTGAYGRTTATNPTPLAVSTESREVALGAANGPAPTAPSTPTPPAGDTGNQPAPNLTASTGGQANGVLSGKPLDTTQPPANNTDEAKKPEADSTAGDGSATSGVAGSTSATGENASSGGDSTAASDDGTSEQHKQLMKRTRPELEKEYLDLVPAGDPGKFANKTDLATAIADALADANEV